MSVSVFLAVPSLSRRLLSLAISVLMTGKTILSSNGGAEDVNEVTVRLVKEAGFTCAVTTRRGLNTMDTPRLELRRGGPWERHLPTYAVKLARYQQTGA